MSKKEKKPSPFESFLARLRKITGALEYLVEVQSKEEFLETFSKLHSDNVAQYLADEKAANNK